MAHNNRNWPDLIPKISGWIAGFIAFATVVVGFIKLWQGDTGLVTIVLLAIGVGGGTLGCAYLAFKRTPPLVEGSKRTWQYPRWRPRALAGLVILLLTKYEVGYRHYQQIIQLQYDEAMAYYNRGNAYALQDDYDRAIADFDQAIQLQPDYANAYFNRGLVYADRGDYDRAIANFDQAIQLRPDLAVAYHSRGLAYTQKGEKRDAIADFKKVLELSNDPDLRKQAEELLKALGAK